MAVVDVEIVFGGVATKIIVVPYADRVWVTLTQLPTFGTLISVSAEDYPDGMRFFNARTLLGRRDDDEMMTALARRLAEEIYLDVQLPSLFAIGIRPSGDEASAEALVRSVLAWFSAHRPWTAGYAAGKRGAGSERGRAMGAAAASGGVGAEPLETATPSGAAAAAAASAVAAAPSASTASQPVASGGASSAAAALTDEARRALAASFKPTVRAGKGAVRTAPAEFAPPPDA